MEYNGQATATPASSSMPYSVQYSAGRFPGHVDRVQSEYGDGAGVIHGKKKQIISQLCLLFGILHKTVHELQSFKNLLHKALKIPEKCKFLI